jgi:hypothetical protein
MCVCMRERGSKAGRENILWGIGYGPTYPHLASHLGHTSPPYLSTGEAVSERGEAPKALDTYIYRPTERGGVRVKGNDRAKRDDVPYDDFSAAG